MDGLTDPERLVDEVVTETTTVPPGPFEHFDGVDGVVAVGVTNDDGDVLLWTDDDHGWLLPAAPVDPDADYAAAGRAVVERLAGGSVDVESVERVRRVTYTVDGDDAETTALHAVVHATAGDDPLPADPPGTDTADAGWFDAVPADVHSTAEAADVRLFVD